MKKQILAPLLALFLLAACGKTQVVYVDRPVSEGPELSYAMDAVTATDQDTLQAAVDEAIQKSGELSMGLTFKNVAISYDGINFDCYLGNSDSNEYDMYIQIFGDEALTDELYLSGLIRPGEAFDHLTLNHALNLGSHDVYVSFTQVESNGEGGFNIVNQRMISIEFIVEQG